MKSETETPEESRHLIFQVGGHDHAIGLLEVREITECDSLASMPTADRALRGVIDLRGAAVPVVDLAPLLGLSPAEPGKDACVLVVDVEVRGRPATIGLLAGSVSGVAEITPELLQPLPATGSEAAGNCLRGIARLEGKFVPVLDLPRLLAAASLTTPHSSPHSL
ncbi:MAG: chemotaxis protein CheW [Deltaproteobacteria bacterium]|nr:chemotaxis protein CheW [Deltaproteobacteria bacterium]